MTKDILTTKMMKVTKSGGFETRPYIFLRPLHCYPKTKTNMFVIECKVQAAIFRVWNVASISR